MYNTEQIENLQSLIKSKGWKTLCEIYKSEQLKISEKLIENFGDNTEETEKEILKFKAINEILKKPGKIIGQDKLKNNKKERLLGDFS